MNGSQGESEHPFILSLGGGKGPSDLPPCPPCASKQVEGSSLSPPCSDSEPFLFQAGRQPGPLLEAVGQEPEVVPAMPRPIGELESLA